jgi:hypothetical protein
MESQLRTTKEDKTTKLSQLKMAQANKPHIERERERERERDTRLVNQEDNKNQEDRQKERKPVSRISPASCRHRSFNSSNRREGWGWVKIRTKIRLEKTKQDADGGRSNKTTQGKTYKQMGNDASSVVYS